MPYILPKPDFNGSNIQFATITPQVFTPKQADVSLLARSLDKIEQREQKVADQKLAMDEAFATARNLLPDNEETNAYITDNQNRISNTINELINIGDFGNALKMSKQLAGQFTSSPEFIARTKEHKQRTAWLEDLDKANVDQYIKDYYKDVYSDTNNFTRDANGNITGTAGWKAPTPEQGQSANSIIQAAVKATAEERTDNAGQWTKEDGTGGHSANRREWLTADRISQTAKSLVDNDPRVKQAFIDQFNAGIHQINKLTKILAQTTDPTRRAEIENQINGYKSSYYKNGAPMESSQAYIDNLFDPNNNEIKNAAYDYKHKSTGSDKYGRGNSNMAGYEFNSVGGGDLESTNGAPVNSTIGNSSSMPSKSNRNGLKYVAPSNSWSNVSN